MLLTACSSLKTLKRTFILRDSLEIGRFLVRLAATGAQVVIETHSDHILNGIRLAVTAERLLAAEDVAIHFLGSSEGENTEISLGSTGTPRRLAYRVL